MKSIARAAAACLAGAIVVGETRGGGGHSIGAGAAIDRKSVV